MNTPKLNKKETREVAHCVQHVTMMGGKVDAHILNHVIGGVLRRATSKASDKRLRAAFSHYLGLSAIHLDWGLGAQALNPWLDATLSQ